MRTFLSALVVLVGCDSTTSTSDDDAPVSDSNASADDTQDSVADSDPATSVSDSSTPEPNTGPLSFEQDIFPMLRTRCGCCHLGTASSGSFNFENGLDDLIGVVAGNGQDYIVPFEPEESYFWHKLNDTQASVGGTGAVMPLEGMLPQADLDLIERWILEGVTP